MAKVSRNSKIALGAVLTALLLIMGLSFDPPTEHFMVAGFRGIQGNLNTDSDMNLPYSLQNLDVVFRGPESILKLRSGYSRVGNAGDLEDYPVTGIFSFNPSDGGDQTVVTSGFHIYVYDELNSQWSNASVNPLAGTCSIESGNDTLTGSGTHWWELGLRDFDFISIYDADGDTMAEQLIKSILGNELIILDTAWRANDQTAVACTLVATFTPDDDTLFADPYEPKHGEMFMDELIIVDQNERVRYTNFIEGLSADIKTYTDVLTWGKITNGYGLYLQTSEANFTGWSIYDWIQFQSAAPDTISDTSAEDDGDGHRIHNIALQLRDTKPGERQAFHAPEQVYDWLRSNTGNIYAERIPADSIEWETVIDSFSIADVDVDSTRYAGPVYFYEYTIHNFDNDDIYDWDVDTADFLTWYTPDANQPRYPVWFFRENDSTKIKVFDFCEPSNHKFTTSDSLLVHRMVRYSNEISADNITVEDEWGDELQAVLNSKLYYAGYDSSMVWYLRAYKVDSSAANVQGNFYVNPDDGDIITALQPDGRNLVVFKKRGVYLAIIGYDNEFDELIKLESPIGAPNQQATCVYAGDVYFVGPPHGVYRIQDRTITKISHPVKSFIADSIRAGQELTIRTFVFFDVTIGTNGLYICYAGKSSDKNDRTLRYDLETGDWTYYTNFGASTFGLFTSGSGFGDTLLFGSPVTDAGNSGVFKFPSGTSDTGAAIIGTYISPNVNLGTNLLEKRWTDFMPMFRAEYTGTLLFYFYADYDNGYDALVTITPGLSGGTWQTPHYGILDLQGKNLSGQALRMQMSVTNCDTAEFKGFEFLYEDAGGYWVR